MSDERDGVRRTAAIGNPLAWLPRVKVWCARYGYPLPERFRKLEALRGGG
jgi:hypothetical protein